MRLSSLMNASVTLRDADAAIQVAHCECIMQVRAPKRLLQPFHSAALGKHVRYSELCILPAHPIGARLLVDCVLSLMRRSDSAASITWCSALARSLLNQPLGIEREIRLIGCSTVRCTSNRVVAHAV
jgi:hypothetical protein